MDFFDFIKNNKLIILIISVIMNVLLILISSYFAINYFNYECITENNNLAVSSESKYSNDSFYVEIKGAVKNPGVYKANSDNIINDIITLAGGFTKKAYTNNINLSKKVSDELVIYVYTNSEYKKKKSEDIVQNTCECPTYEINNCTDNLVSEIVVNPDSDTTKNDNNTNSSIYIEEEKNNKNDNKTETPETKLVNINSASKEELMNLSGIGESKADAIIEYRTNTEKFKSIEDIKKVSGIGDSLFEKIKDNITV